ncbi:MAG: DUF4249 domain-containing protein [bacterium]
MIKIHKILSNFWLIPVFLACFSCSNELELDFPIPDDKIVVDAWIETGTKASVVLTANSPYLSNLDSVSLRELVLTQAKVTLSDGSNTEILTLRRNDDYFPPFVYESTSIKGEYGKTYTMTAEYAGKYAWASTTIPRSIKIDTAYYRFVEDTLAEIYIEFIDPLDEKNFYRVFTQIKGVESRYYSIFVLALDDIHFNGKKFGFTILRGPKTYLSSEGNAYFQVGDTVNIKFCTIDKAHFAFWNSYQEEVLNAGNPFATSVAGINSNVEGDGLGLFGGYGTSFYQVVIKKGR